MQTHDISGVMPPSRYRDGRTHIFPSDGSLTWYIRQHRRALVEKEALLLINGRWSINAERMDAFVLEAGSAAAKRQSAA